MTQPEPTRPAPQGMFPQADPFAAGGDATSPYAPYAAPHAGPAPYGGLAPHPGPGPVGKVRGTGAAILLTLVTFGCYALYWTYSVHKEIKRHTGAGLGGGLALLLAVFVGIVMPFVTASEVGGLYERRGEHPPVSGTTGLWSFPGALILVGPLVWFVKTNGALNDYWRSVGAEG